jgi:hypothetical protein
VKHHVSLAHADEERNGTASVLLGSPQPISKPALALLSAIAVLAVAASAVLLPLLAIGVIVTFLFSVWIIRYPAAGAYLLVAVVPIVSGLRRDVPVPGLRISELLVATIAALVLVFASRANWQRSRWNSVDRWLFAYALFSVLVSALHLGVRGSGVPLELIGSTLLPLQFFLMYRAVLVALPASVQRGFALKLLLLASLVACGLAIVQQLDIGPARELVVALTDSGSLQSASYEFYARATGPFQHWHTLAGYLTVILLVAVALLLQKDQQILSQRWLWIVTAAASAALMLSVTFTSIIGVVVGVVILGWRYGQLGATLKWCSLGLLLAMGLFGSFVVERFEDQYFGREGAILPQTISMRLDVWINQYIPGLSGYWALGYGPDLPNVVTWEHTESAYITLLLRGGLPLLFLFVMGLLFILDRTRRAETSVPHERAAVAALFVVVAVSFFMNLLFPYATSSGMSQPLWALAGIALGSQLSGPSLSRERST